MNTILLYIIAPILFKLSPKAKEAFNKKVYKQIAEGLKTQMEE